MEDKLAFSGRVVAIQPRIRLMRSFDQRDHSYLGYSLRIDGTINDLADTFTVGIGKALQAKHCIEGGNEVDGLCVPVQDPDLEPISYYMVSKFKTVSRSQLQSQSPPPWLGVPPTLETYRARGHRRLAGKTYDKSCTTCIWGCRMAVEMIIDQWNPSQRRYRLETFCYGPKTCKLYHSGQTRKVPGRKGMTWEEEDWVDEEATAHRGQDE
jgi:hypothetical protein